MVGQPEGVGQAPGKGLGVRGQWKEGCTSVHVGWQE